MRQRMDMPLRKHFGICGIVRKYAAEIRKFREYRGAEYADGSSIDRLVHSVGSGRYIVRSRGMFRSARHNRIHATGQG